MTKLHLKSRMKKLKSLILGSIPLFQVNGLAQKGNPLAVYSVEVDKLQNCTPMPKVVDVCIQYNISRAGIKVGELIEFTNISNLTKLAGMTFDPVVHFEEFLNSRSHESLFTPFDSKQICKTTITDDFFSY